MKMIRAALFQAFLFGTAIIGSLYAYWLRRSAPERVLPLGQAWSRLLMRGLRVICGITLDVQGFEHIPATGAALIAAQHQSAFDTMVWLVLLRDPSYVLKQELTRIPFFGKLFVASGHISLDREGGARSLRNLIGAVQQAAKRGKQIIIFPEGTRVPPGQRVPLQVGIAALSRATVLPVIPVATDSGLFWPRHPFRMRPGLIHIRIYPALPAATDRVAMMRALEQVFYGDA
jgi:1-acyl-sn-glycerol-3-phosphate acyltransferase